MSFNFNGALVKPRKQSSLRFSEFLIPTEEETQSSVESTAIASSEILKLAETD